MSLKLGMKKLNRLRRQIMAVLIVSLILIVILISSLIELDKDLIVISLLLALIVLSVSTVLLLRIKNQSQVLKQIEVTIQKITNDDVSSPIFLEPANPFKKVSDELNNLSSVQREKIDQVQKENSELISVLNTLPVGIMVLDAKRDVLFSNPRISQILGNSIDKKIHPYTQDITNYQLLSIIDEVFDNKSSNHSEVRSLTDNSVTWDTQVIYNAISQEDYHVLLIMYDISEIINVKQMQIDFLRNASHELKTPVTAISGFAKTLLDGAMDDKKSLVEFLKIIDQQSDQLISLIQDVLTISHVQTKKDYRHITTNLKSYVDDRLKNFQALAQKKGLKVSNKVPKGIEVNIDHDALKRIFDNLVSNAIKYNVLGGDITVSCNKENNFWQLKISDTGIGIAQKDIPRLFERFYRADESRNKQEISGTGLGLSIVKEIIDSLGGNIRVKSQRGVGSTFTVTFPNF